MRYLTCWTNHPSYPVPIALSGIICNIIYIGSTPIFALFPLPNDLSHSCVAAILVLKLVFYDLSLYLLCLLIVSLVLLGNLQLIIVLISLWTLYLNVLEYT